METSLSPYYICILHSTPAFVIVLTMLLILFISIGWSPSMGYRELRYGSEVSIWTNSCSGLICPLFRNLWMINIRFFSNSKYISLFILYLIFQLTLVVQDLFSSGVIKSATDFQVYKEVAGLSGLDFAYVDMTAVYHTKVLLKHLNFWMS